MAAPADPHAAQPVARAGAPLERAAGAVVLLHGRGATAESILALAGELDRPDLAYLAPQAAGSTWYPYSFLAPLAANEPWLSSALAAVGRALALAAAAGHGAGRVALVGFSQGACLALEHVARAPRRYAGVAGLSGGLIGPDGAPRPLPPAGAERPLAGTPVFLGCGVPDPHIPAARVEETAGVLEALGGAVTMRLYPGLGHTVNADELAHVRRLLP
ncbi:MAG TPA: dienelactone hydrolase family protein [Thermoanaerobaculia bacterium]|nr:dienelactone hydrolase family protein [Thermoanaerobaculia bacterium]